MKESNQKGTTLITTMVIIIIIIGITGVMLMKLTSHMRLVKVQKSILTAKFSAKAGIRATVMAIIKYKDTGVYPVEVHGNSCDWDSIIVKLSDNRWEQLKNGEEYGNFATEAIATYNEKEKNIRARTNYSFRSFVVSNNNDFVVHSNGVYEQTGYAIKANIKRIEESSFSQVPRNAADKILKLGGKSPLYSYSLLNPLDTKKVHFVSNGSIQVSGNPHKYIYGELHPGKDDGDTISVKSSQIIADGLLFEEAINPQNKEVVLPPVIINFPTSPSPTTKTIQPGETDIWSGVLNYNDLTVHGNVTIRGNTTLYVNGDFKVTGGKNNGGTTISFEEGATLTIYVSGKFSFSAHTSINDTADPNKLKVFVGIDSVTENEDGTPIEMPGTDTTDDAKTTWGDVKLTAWSNFYGLIYAPKATVKISGHGQFYGNVVGKQVKISGQSNFYDYLDGNYATTTFKSYTYILDETNMNKTNIINSLSGVIVDNINTNNTDDLEENEDEETEDLEETGDSENTNTGNGNGKK